MFVFARNLLESRLSSAGAVTIVKTVQEYEGAVDKDVGPRTVFHERFLYRLATVP